MFTILESNVSYRACPRLTQPFVQHDLYARLEPLDRYGLTEISSALVDGLFALANWSKEALRAILRCARI